MTVQVLLLAALAIAASPTPASPDAAGVPLYRMSIRVDPAVSRIEGTVEIESPRSTTFSLARPLAIRRVLAGGKPVMFEERPPAHGAVAREIAAAAPLPTRLRIEYSGTLGPDAFPPVIGLVSRVEPDLVELASYAAWYPQPVGGGAFRFELKVDLPAPFVTVTNGRLADERLAGDRRITTWASDAAVGDVLLVAAPRLRRTVGAHAGTRVELYASRLPAAYVEAMDADVRKAIAVLSELHGVPLPADRVVVVYAPRPGWGYVRAPLIVVSEDSALAMREQPFGSARDLRYIAHEVAHSWWHLADTSTPDDWINEGLAEYSALLASEAISGPQFAARLVQEYEEQSAASATTAAIAATEHGSPDREVNRYARPVLMLHEARRVHGADRLRGFLQSLYRRFTCEGATTEIFLDEAAARLGPAARERFAEVLHRRDWSAQGPPRLAYDPAAHRVFLGTWTGTLTQGSIVTRVVLHLRAEGGWVGAALDSPDQGVQGIPVPAVAISDGCLHLGLGAFGVSFTGALDTSSEAIAGEWRQGGAAFPLRLVKSADPGR